MAVRAIGKRGVRARERQGIENGWDAGIRTPILRARAAGPANWTTSQPVRDFRRSGGGAQRFCAVRKSS